MKTIIILMAVMFCSFSAHSHPLWDDEVLELIELSDIMDIPTDVIDAYIWKEEGALFGENYYLHYHHYHRRGWSRKWAISKEEYMEVKNNIGTSNCLMIPYVDPFKVICFRGRNRLFRQK